MDGFGRSCGLLPRLLWARGKGGGFAYSDMGRDREMLRRKGVVFRGFLPFWVSIFPSSVDISW